VSFDERSAPGIEQAIAAVEHQTDFRCDFRVAGASRDGVRDQEPTRDLVHDRRVQQVQPQLDERVGPDLSLRRKPQGERPRVNSSCAACEVRGRCRRTGQETASIRSRN